MKIEYDREVDALYVRLQEKFVAKTVEVDEGINIDFDEGGRLIGLEILDATERYALSDIFNISTENLFPEDIRPCQAPVVGVEIGRFLYQTSKNNREQKEGAVTPGTFYSILRQSRLSKSDFKK
jgi:uncharacterized protein YuzE